MLDRIRRRKLAAGLTTLALSASLGAMTAATPAHAAASAYGGCYFEAKAPTIQLVSGKVYGKANATVSCDITKKVQFEVQLREDDVTGFDLAGTSTFQINLLKSAVTKSSNAFNCNLDVGTDELYSAVRIRIWTATGWTNWSVWNKSAIATATCTS